MIPYKSTGDSPIGLNAERSGTLNVFITLMSLTRFEGT